MAVFRFFSFSVISRSMFFRSMSVSVDASTPDCLPVLLVCFFAPLAKRLPLRPRRHGLARYNPEIVADERCTPNHIAGFH
jgi:hypothetical protein